MNILDDPLIKKYFTPDEACLNTLHYNLEGKGAYNVRSLITTFNILKAMQIPIRKGDLSIQLRDNGDVDGPYKANQDLDKQWHTWCLRLPDEFQKNECRKARSFRDYLFEQMKDREFFEAYMDEPCPKCSESKVASEACCEFHKLLNDGSHCVWPVEKPCVYGPESPHSTEGGRVLHECQRTKKDAVPPPAPRENRGALSWEGGLHPDLPPPPPPPSDPQDIRKKR